MKYLYLAFDGTIHSTEAECLKHEASHLFYRAFDVDGTPTHDLVTAKVVYVYPNGGERLTDNLYKAGRQWYGLTANSSGWYFLCEECEEWSPISEGLVKLFSQKTP
jgi:hypothetical protein